MDFSVKVGGLSVLYIMQRDTKLQRRIGRKIREARVAAGLSQKGLATHLGRTGTALGYIESGQRRIDLSTLEIIAHAVQKPLDYFFEEKKFVVENKLFELERKMKELRKLFTARGGGGDR